MQEPRPGTITWTDLTIVDADHVREFYQAVVGWTAHPVDMGGYADYSMVPPGADAPVAGICHARGVNADLPPVWLVYITVEDLDASMRACEARGGRVLQPARDLGPSLRFCVIEDPAGAVAALIQSVSGS